jgi:uncharacterized protein YjbI with pentapeptide repeats
MSLGILGLLALLVAGDMGEGMGEQPVNNILAAEIVSQFAEGEPVYLQDATIIGELNLSTLPNSSISSSLEIINSTISEANFEGITFEKDVILWGTSLGNASFDKATFHGSADLSNTSFGNASFEGTSFSQPVTFDGAVFLDNVSFQDALFQKDASFNYARFVGNADFNYSRFGYYTYFSGAHFFKDASFSDIDFSGALDFSSSAFSGEANFFQSRFSTADFSNAVFSGPAQFGLTRFSGLSSFGDAVFAGPASFALARFSDAAYFSGAEFRDIALFGLAKFEDIVSFQQAKFEEDINFKGATISTMLLDEARYGKEVRMILNDTEFGRFKAHWDEIIDHVVWDPGAFLALVENYRRLGWSSDEDDCYYQYRRLDQAHKGFGWSKAIDMLAWLSCGYGVRPGYAVIWSLLTILVFALLFWIGNGIRRSAKPLQGPMEKDSVPEKATFGNALFFSTMIFLSQGPIDFLPVGRNRYLVILEGVLGWLMLALFLVTLGRVMIR